VKTTLEIDDALYREVKALSALTGRKMKDLVSDGLRYVLNPTAGPGVPDKGNDAAALAELRQWFKAADRAMKKAPSGPSARELLEADRRRLETP
jgi:hypothetical protein